LLWGSGVNGTEVARKLENSGIATHCAICPAAEGTDDELEGVDIVARLS
jgi:hypothetical protein